MYLKSLELSGFKSFAKKSALSFTAPITSIVGPNGSGKSNTAEAFRFVLGEQSLKSLRGKRGEDMIWNGGGDSIQGPAKANRASVKLVFDNAGRKLFPAIDFDEVSVERVVHRDNTNEYLLNGSAVRLKDIQELLAAAHIGATGHHIISQGEADRILTASAREKREMIEDALGLKAYQWKKIESLRKLERTEENMERVASLRREIAPHIKFLKKQVEKIEKAVELRTELAVLCKEYFAGEDAYIRAERERIAADLRAPTQELERLDKELAHATRIVADSAKADAKSAEAVSLEAKLAQIRVDKGAIARELGRIEGEIAANSRAMQRERERLHRDEHKTVYLKDVESVISEVEALDVTQGTQAFFAAVLRVLKGFVSRHREVVTAPLLAEAEREASRLSMVKTEAEQRMRTLAETEAATLKRYEEIRQAIEREKDSNRDAEKEMFRIAARKNEVRHAVDALTAANALLDREEEAFKRDLVEARVAAGREAVDYEKGGDMRGMDRALQADLRKRIEKNRIRLEDAGIGGGDDIMKEYKDTEERDAFLARELEDLGKAKAELLALIADLDARIDYEFKSGVLKINTEFHRLFALMFGGGKAELALVREQRRRKKSDMEDLADALAPRDGISDTSAEQGGRDEQGSEGPEGLEVNVSLPRKKVKGLMMLSGGERALTSIALLFAISQVNPPPFIILDETDAALDEANSKKYGDMIESLSQHSQLILITHNRETMSRAGVLYGVTMGADGASRLLSIQFEEAVKVAK